MAHEFIVIALTEKWEASAVLIQILCVAGAVSPVSALLGNAIVSSGRSGTFFRATLVVGLANIVLMCVLWPWGIHVMVVAYVLLAAAATSLCTWAATAQVPGLWLRLAARVALAAALYYGVMRVAGANILEECMQFLKGKR